MKGAHSATAFRLFFAATLTLCAGFAHAQTAPISAAAIALGERYPQASITSNAQAQAALRVAGDASAQAQWSAYEQEVQCQGRFFVTSCVKEVQGELRAAMAQIKRVEVEANRYLRRAKDAEREQRRQDAQRQAAAEEQQLAAVRQQAEADFKHRQEEAALREEQAKARDAQRAAAAEENARRNAARITRASQANPLESDAVARADNVRAFEAKQKAAELRRAEIAKRRAERAARNGAAKP